MPTRAPAASMAARISWSSAASGVVCEAGRVRPGRRTFTVPTTPVGTPAAAAQASTR